MTTINLKDFYYWYTQDQFIEVSDEIAEVFVADARHEMAYQRRLSRHKAQYSLDCDDGIEYSACLHEPTPQELLERIVWRPLFSLRYNSKSIWLFHTRK
jgi:RNA polymerase sigma-70 factor (ECF subfamily)